MERSKRFVKYISDSVANLSSLMHGSSGTYYEPTDRVPLSSISVNGSGEALEWSKEDNGNETVVLRKSEYEQLQSELSQQREAIVRLRRKEDECDKKLRNYDRTLSYVLEKRGEPREEWDDEETSRLRHSEQRLKSHVQALKKDLFVSEDRAEAFRQIAKERIDELLGEVQMLRTQCVEERRRVGMLSDKLVRLENVLETACEEGVEAVEYCKYLLGQ